MDYIILTVTVVLPIVYGAALLTFLLRDVSRQQQQQ